MSGISSGIGLLSGINSAELIEQLINIEAAPKRLLEARVKSLDSKRTAFLELSARILGIKSAATQFNKLSLFQRFNASSTNESAVSAVAGEDAAPGSYTFRVHSLVTSQSVISRGFSSTTTEPVGAGELVIESSRARVNRATELSTLRGGLGVRRGVISITDRSGATAQIDLSTAVTVNDVLDAINNNTSANVTARVTSIAGNGASGDRIVIEDASGGTGNLVVADRPGGFAAADLGLLVNAAVDRKDGIDLVRLTDTTSLSLLNDGNGIGKLLNGPDLNFEASLGSFSVSLTDVLSLDTPLSILNSGEGVRLGTVRITDRSGQSADVDLSQATTARDVRDALNGTGLSISVAIVNSHFQISDTSEVAEGSGVNLRVEDVSGFAAADLGIAADTAETAIFGRDVYRVATIGDAIRAINHAPGNAGFVQASISADGNGLTLEAFGFNNQVTVTAGEGSTAARDLGLIDLTLESGTPVTAQPLLAGLNTVLLQSLRGGAGVSAGAIRFTDGTGASSAIDFSSARTLQDVIDLINEDDTIQVVASVNSAGNGLVLRDESGVPGATIAVQDVTGSLALELGLTTDSNGEPNNGVVNGGNLQLQYVSRQTLLATLNGGRGVSAGEFRITDRTGATYDVNIPANLTTVGQAIDIINGALPPSLRARINGNGDGILLEDTSGGALSLTVSDLNGGRAALDLRLRGTADAGENFIDGSYETRIAIEAGDTLTDVVTKVNDVNGAFTASILNDQGLTNPFRLTISSTSPGRAGELVIDADALGLDFTTLTTARDAVITVGGSTAADGLLVTGTDNQIDDVIPGVSLNLLNPTDDPVTITVAQDVDSIVDDIKEFVDAYNEFQSVVDDDTRYNPDTEERGPLLGEPTVTLLRNRLHRVIQDAFSGTGSISRLSSIGLTLGPSNQLQFNEERFRTTYEASPEQVEQLFTSTDVGFGDKILDTIDGLTRDFDGVLAQQDTLLADQQEILTDQIANLDILLAAKRARLTSQFVALEQSLALLQDQQSALASISRTTTTVR